MSTSFDGLISKVKECGQKTVSVAVAQDSAVLEAVRAAKDRGIANAVLVGDEEKDQGGCRQRRHRYFRF